VLLGHYHFHTKVADGIWYAGSTDSFNFGDDPDKPKGILILDTDSGSVKHKPIQGQRPLITLDPVMALGLSPADLQSQVLERAALVPEGAVARLYLEGVEPEPYRLLDLEAVRDAAQKGLYLKLEPQFSTVATGVELPEMDRMGARWERYLQDQDLTGLDRDRVRHLGLRYLDQAVEAGDR
jgi:hypothetical protein